MKEEEQPDSSNRRIFRRTAIDRRAPKANGTVLIATPFSYSVLAIASALVIVSLIAIAVTCTYTSRVHIRGALLPLTGLAIVYPPSDGVLVRSEVYEGKTVTTGQRLLEISSDTFSPAENGAQAAISDEIRIRETQTRQETARLRALRSSERLQLAEKLRSLQEKVQATSTTIALQEARVSLAADEVLRYDTLLRSGYVSREQRDRTKSEMLIEQQNLEALKRERSADIASVAEQRDSIARLDLDDASATADFSREISQLRQALSESEAKRHSIVTAPMDGTTTAFRVTVGQHVKTDRPLLSIVPTGAKFDAMMVAPSSAIGFLKPGQLVLMKYAAFPYEKYGLQKGVIKTVSKAPVASARLDDQGNYACCDETTMYQVIVEPYVQSVLADGKRQPLQAGMQVDAVVLLERRPLYAWILGPLFVFLRKFQNESSKGSV